MIPVPIEWTTAIREQFRYQAYIKLSITVVPPGIKEGATITSNDTETYASTDYIVDGATTPPSFITNERGRWLLNGKFIPIEPDTQINEWWSKIIQDSSPVQLEVEFDTVYTIPGVYFEWDIVSNTYPSKITLTGYSLSDSQIAQYSIENVSSVSGFVSAPFDNVKKIVIQVDQWNVDNWRARLREVIFGLNESYDSINNGRIQSVESSDSISVIGDALPVKTMQFTLRNLDMLFDPTLKSGISKYLATRQLAEVQWGFYTDYSTLIWTPKIPLYISAFSVPQDSKDVSITIGSRIEFLTDELKTVEYNFESITFYEFAQKVLELSKVIKDSDDQIPWVLGDVLKNYSTNAPVPKSAVNAILQLVAGATCVGFYTDATTGYIVLDQYPANVAQQLTKEQQLGDPSIDVQQTLRSIKVGVYNYYKDTTEGIKEVGTGEYTFSGSFVAEIDYSCSYAADVTCQVSGATLVSVTPYGSSAVVELSSASSVTATVTLKGYEVKSSVTYTELYLNPDLPYGLDVTVDNQLVTNYDVAQHICDFLVDWYSRVQKQTADYIGYPEITAGDTVHVSTIYSDNDCVVLSNKISFNGGFSGVMEVR